MTNTTSDSQDELRELLIDKLDDQRFGDNVVNKKLLYKDIEWIIDELLPVIQANYLSKKEVERVIGSNEDEEYDERFHDTNARKTWRNELRSEIRQALGLDSKREEKHDGKL